MSEEHKIMIYRVLIMIMFVIGIWGIAWMNKSC
jgi:hypothetical protein